MKSRHKSKDACNTFVGNESDEEQGTGNKKVHHDLDHLAGAWSANEADEMEKALAEQRTIFPEESST
jgi:hypothetical protein